MARRSINKCFLSGNLGKDPEIGELKSGEPVAKAPLGVTNYKDETTWANLVFFGKTAGVVQEYCKKGSAITVIGRYQSRKYENKAGDTAYSHEFIVDEMYFGDSPRDDDEDEKPSARSKNGTGSAKAKATATATAKKSKTLAEELEEDDDEF
jgi:single-strand DNA-binding protein